MSKNNHFAILVMPTAKQQREITELRLCGEHNYAHDCQVFTLFPTNLIVVGQSDHI